MSWRKFGSLLALMAGVTRHAPKDRFAFPGLVVWEELRVDHLRHLEHPPGRLLQRLFFAREIAPGMTAIAVGAERLDDEVHLFLELLGIQTGKDLNGRAINDLRLRWLGRNGRK